MKKGILLAVAVLLAMTLFAALGGVSVAHADDHLSADNTCGTSNGIHYGLPNGAASKVSGLAEWNVPVQWDCSAGYEFVVELQGSTNGTDWSDLDSAVDPWYLKECSYQTDGTCQSGSDDVHYCGDNPPNYPSTYYSECVWGDPLVASGNRNDTIQILASCGSASFIYYRTKTWDALGGHAGTTYSASRVGC